MPSIPSVRLDPTTSAALTVAAASAETSVSGFARAAIIKGLPDAATLPPVPPSPPRRRTHIPDADVAAVARLVGEVGKLTGATVQFARALREGRLVPGHAASESVLRDIARTSATTSRRCRRISSRSLRRTGRRSTSPSGSIRGDVSESGARPVDGSWPPYPERRRSLLPGRRDRLRDGPRRAVPARGRCCHVNLMDTAIEDLYSRIVPPPRSQTMAQNCWLQLV